MDFVNEIAALAEEEGHHPVLHVYYAKLIIELWTHAIHGLSENDFILAAKIDAL
jgi:4a-hydroxytetrahydrobiopterin dehydratase